MYALYNHIDIITTLRVFRTGMSTARHYSQSFVRHAKLLHWDGKLKPWSGVAAYKETWDKYLVLDPLQEHLPVRKNRIKRT